MKSITISFTDEAYRQLVRAQQIGARGACDDVVFQIIESIDGRLSLHVFKTREEREAERKTGSAEHP